MPRTAKPITDADRFQQVLDRATAPMTYHDVLHTLNLTGDRRRRLEGVLKKDLVPEGKRRGLIAGDHPKLVWPCDTLGLPVQPVPAWAVSLITDGHMAETKVPEPNFETLIRDVEISQQWEFVKERVAEIEDKVVQRQTLAALSTALRDFVMGRGGSREALRMTLGASLELVGHVLLLQSALRAQKAVAPMHENLIAEIQHRHKLELSNQRLRLTYEPTAEASATTAAEPPRFQLAGKSE